MRHRNFHIGRHVDHHNDVAGRGTRVLDLHRELRFLPDPHGAGAGSLHAENGALSREQHARLGSGVLLANVGIGFNGLCGRGRQFMRDTSHVRNLFVIRQLAGQRRLDLLNWLVGLGFRFGDRRGIVNLGLDRVALGRSLGRNQSAATAASRFTRRLDFHAHRSSHRRTNRRRRERTLGSRRRHALSGARRLFLDDRGLRCRGPRLNDGRTPGGRSRNLRSGRRLRGSVRRNLSGVGALRRELSRRALGAYVVLARFVAHDFAVGGGTAFGPARLANQVTAKLLEPIAQRRRRSRRFSGLIRGKCRRAQQGTGECDQGNEEISTVHAHSP